MSDTKPNQLANLSGYTEFLHDLKTRIRSAQVKAAVAVNREHRNASGERRLGRWRH